jgi:hypothetical protein
MFNSASSTNDELLFEERLPEFQTHRQVIITVWLLRAVIILLFFMMWCVVNDTPKLKPGGQLPMIIFIGFMIFIFLTMSEWIMRKPRMASVSVRLFSNRIEMHSFPYERILGFNGCILKEDVKHVDIGRGKMLQRLNRQSGLLRWENAPISYQVITRKGKMHSSGQKPPGQVIAMTEAIRIKWGVPVIDPGEGMGRMTEYNGEKGNQSRPFLVNDEETCIMDNPRDNIIYLLSIIFPSLISSFLIYLVINNISNEKSFIIYTISTPIISYFFWSCFYRDIYNRPSRIKFYDDGILLLFTLKKEKFVHWDEIRKTSHAMGDRNKLRGRGIRSGALFLNNSFTPVLMEPEIICEIRRQFYQKNGRDLNKWRGSE